MKSETISFIKYLFGLRKARTSDTDAEISFLSALAAGKKCAVEIGVYEGVASRAIAGSISRDGRLYLVDPYTLSLKLERLLGFSFFEYVAKDNLKRYLDRVEFVKMASVEASRVLPIKGKADFIFIDAKHDYESVLADFKAYEELLSPGGIVAFHDSCECPARPDLNDHTGPVRLVNEILSGLHGPWRKVDSVDSITVIAKR